MESGMVQDMPQSGFCSELWLNLDALAQPKSVCQHQVLIGNVAQVGSDTTSITMEISKQLQGPSRSKGKTIVKLQRESGTIIRMSQIYPNVNTRYV